MSCVHFTSTRKYSEVTVKLLFKDSLNLNAFSSLTWVWVIPVPTSLTKGVKMNLEVLLILLFTERFNVFMTVCSQEERRAWASSPEESKMWSDFSSLLWWLEVCCIRCWDVGGAYQGAPGQEPPRGQGHATFQ